MSQLHRPTALFLAACLLPAGATSGQTEPTTHPPVAAPSPSAIPPASRTPDPGGLAPAGAHTWLRIRGFAGLEDGNGRNPIATVALELARTNGQIGRKLASSWLGAAVNGGQVDSWRAMLAEDLRLAVTTRHGAETFLLWSRIPEADARVALSRLGARRNGTGRFSLACPWDAETTWTALVMDGWLLVASNEESADTGVELLRGKGAPLSQTVEFETVMANADEKAWLTFFARPSQLSEALGPLAQRWLGNISLTRLSALAWTSTYASKRFEDKLRIKLASREESPFEFVPASGGVSKRLSRFVGSQHSQWFAINFDSSGLLRLVQQKNHRPWAGRLHALATLLSTKGGTGDLASSLSALGSQILLLHGSNVESFVLVPQDSKRIATALNEISSTITAPKTGQGGDQGKDDLYDDLLGEDRSMGFELELGGLTFHARLVDDVLVASTSSEMLAKLLESDNAASPLFERADSSTWMLGGVQSGTWLVELDQSGDRGLRTLGDTLEPVAYVGTWHDPFIEITATGTTGSAHCYALAFEQLIQRAKAATAPATAQQVIDRARMLQVAARSFIEKKVIDTDADGKGEVGPASQLLAKRFVVDPDAFRSIDRDVIASQGYRFRILAPLDADGAESSYLIVSWPVSGKGTSVVVTPQGKVYTRTDADIDIERGPSLAEILIDGTYGKSIDTRWSEWQPPIQVANQPAVTQGISPDIAIKMLDSARERTDVAMVRSFLKHENPDVQARALHYLGDLKDRDSVPQIARLLEESQNLRVRRRAARALALVHDQRGMKSMIGALADTDAQVRLFAATGLIGRKSDQAQTGLLEMIDAFTGDEHGDRTQAVLALHDMGDPSCLRNLAVSSSGNSRFQQALVYCFQDLSPKLSEADETQVLITALESPNSALRAYSIQRLAAAGRVDAVASLKARLHDESAELRPLLERAIQTLSPKTGFDVDKFKRLAKEKYTAFLAWFKQQDKKVQLGVGLAPLGILLLFMLIWLARRRRHRRQAQEQIQELLQPSYATGGQPAAAPSQYDSQEPESEYQEPFLELDESTQGDFAGYEEEEEARQPDY